MSKNITPFQNYAEVGHNCNASYFYCS